MTFINEFADVSVNESHFAHLLKAEQDLHISNVAEEALNHLKSATDPQLIMYEGSMGSGKTTVTTILNKYLDDSIILRLDDNRAPPGEMYIRNNFKLKEGAIVELFENGKGLSIVKQLIDKMKPGSTFFLSEAQFLGTNDEIGEAIDYALGKGIHVVCDCLSVFYNGRRVSGSQYIKSRADKHFDMWPCDSFAEGRGEIPMRMVRIDIEGNLTDDKDKESSHFYVNMSQDERRQIFNNIKNSEFGSKLILIEEGKEVCLVPSHPTLDESYIPGGNERYFSTSVTTCKRILVSAGLNKVAEIYEQIKQEEA